MVNISMHRTVKSRLPVISTIIFQEKIDEYIQKEAPLLDVHDIAYSEALRGAYNVYKNMTHKRLLECQKLARTMYDSSHKSTAECVVLYELIKEKNNNRMHGTSN